MKTVSLATYPQNSSPGPILPILIGQETTGPCKWQETSSCHSAGNDTQFLTGEHFSLGIHKHLSGAGGSRTPASAGQSGLRKRHLIFFFLPVLPSLPSMSRCQLRPQGPWALTKANARLKSFLCWKGVLSEKWATTHVPKECLKRGQWRRGEGIPYPESVPRKPPPGVLELRVRAQERKGNRGTWCNLGWGSSVIHSTNNLLSYDMVTGTNLPTTMQSQKDKERRESYGIQIPLTYSYASGPKPLKVFFMTQATPKGGGGWWVYTLDQIPFLRTPTHMVTNTHHSINSTTRLANNAVSTKRPHSYPTSCKHCAPAARCVQWAAARRDMAFKAKGPEGPPSPKGKCQEDRRLLC